MKSYYNKLLSIISIFSLGIIVYSNSFHCSFHYDDDPNIIDNVAIRNIYNLKDIWSYYHSRFFAFFSLAFNYHFNGLNVFGYHLFNLAVHLGSAILVWWLTLLTLSTPAMKEDKITQHANLIALFAGLVFVSHPVQTEAVTYILERAASLTALFYLASLCCYIKFRLLCYSPLFYKEGLGEFKVPKEVYYFFSLLMALLAMFTKENSVTLPLMILLYEYTFLNTETRFNWLSFRTFAVTQKNLVPFLLTIFIIPVTLLFSKSQTFQGLHGDLNVQRGVITPLHYLLTQFRGMITYLRLIIFPLNQNIDYDYHIFKSFFELPVLISFLFLITIFYWAIRLFSKYRLVSFSIFWFFLTLTIPESSFWAMGDIVFEHRLYLPLVGYSIFIVCCVYYFFENYIMKMAPTFGQKEVGIPNSLIKNTESIGMVIVLTLIISCNSILTYQ